MSYSSKGDVLKGNLPESSPWLIKYDLSSSGGNCGLFLHWGTMKTELSI